MPEALRSVSVVLVTVATAICGVLLLGGVGPGPVDARSAGEVLPGVVPESSAPATSDPIENTADVTSTTVGSSSPTTTTPIAAATSSNATSTTMAGPLSLLPLSVSASQTVVGAGGTVDFAGTCPTIDGATAGGVTVWVISDTIEQIATGATATEWTYQWTAPTDPKEFASHAFQFWCGDPDGWQGGYPAELQRTVDMVAQVAPTPTITNPPIETDPPSIIPETG